MRAWLACAILVAVCVRVAWVARSRQSTQIAALVAVTAVVLTVLR